MDQQAQQIENKDGSGALSFADARDAVLKRIKAVVALPVLLALCTATIVFLTPDRYDAMATIQIDPRQTLIPSAPSAAPPIAQPKPELRTIEDEIDALQSAPVIRRVVSELGLADDPEFGPRWPVGLAGKLLRKSATEAGVEAAVSARLNITRVRSTFLLEVRFSSSDPEKSARIANAIAGAYLRDRSQAAGQTASTTPNEGSATRQDATRAGDNRTASERMFQSLLVQYGQPLQLSGPRLVTQAEPPRMPAGPKRRQQVLMSFGTGLIIAIGLALLLEIKTSGSIKTLSVQKAFACPHMTSLPAMPVPDAARLPTRAMRLVIAEPAGRYAEAVRNAASELDRRHTGAPSRLVLVVSALPGEGAELFASNLAHHFAITGHSPLLIDADMRMKGLTRQLAGQCLGGLLDQIASRSPIEEAILRDGMTSLHFLPASGPAPTPLSVPSALRSPEFTATITALKERFATIIVSAPPILPVSDARVLAGLADQIVFVTAWHKTPRHLAKKALASLGTNQSKVLGAVLTDMAEDTDASIMSFSDIFDEIRRATTLASSSERAA